MAEKKQIKTALVSVFHKDGLDELLKKLNEEGVKFLSTGGTQKFIESLGYECQKVEDVTTYPSILGGRVKTLHPKVFDGFAGTGMTGVAAAACSNSEDTVAQRINKEWKENYGCEPQWGTRHAICGDLSPYATNIAYFYNTPVDVAALKKDVERIKQEMDAGDFTATSEKLKNKPDAENLKSACTGAPAAAPRRGEEIGRAHV